MMDTTTVDWLGEAVGSKGKRKIYTKAIINKKVVRITHFSIYLIAEN